MTLLALYIYQFYRTYLVYRFGLTRREQRVCTLALTLDATVR